MSQIGDDVINNNGADGAEVQQNVATAATQQNELQALREKLEIMRQIQQLQHDIGLAPPPTRSTQVSSAIPKNIKVPEGRYNMSLAEFRTYKRDCIDYKTLTGYNDNIVVIQMRLNMDSDLKQSVDTNYPDWGTLTVEDAVKTIGEIVNQMSNIAVYRKTFHEMVQTETEILFENSQPS